jgi:hypothetical protein
LIPPDFCALQESGSVQVFEDKIALQRQRAERLHLQNDDTAVRLISVLQESLARAKAHAQYIEQRIAKQEADSSRRTALAALIHVARIELTIAEYDRNVKALENAIRAEEDSDWHPRPGAWRVSWCREVED